MKSSNALKQQIAFLNPFQTDLIYDSNQRKSHFPKGFVVKYARRAEIEEFVKYPSIFGRLKNIRPESCWIPACAPINSIAKPNKMPETKTHQRFRARIEYLEQHLQLVDVALAKFAQQARPEQDSNRSLCDIFSLDSQRHTRLDHPKREVARLTSFSRSKNVEMALVMAYRYFGEYLRGILREIYDHDPKMVVGKAPGSISYHDIVDLSNIEDIINRMIDDVFRRLEGERSTIKLLDKILQHTGVALTEATKSKALAYLDLRHLIIHQQSKIDDKYVAAHGHILDVAEGAKIPLRFQTAEDAIKAIVSMIDDIDTQLIGSRHVMPVS